jgi:hypothetical protein
METDRQLLELAAKAAGIEATWSIPWQCMVIISGDIADPWAQPKWNPLTDDGDALRLAAKLGILELAGAEIDLTCNQDVDVYATARRAIVRSAAEIGRYKNT